MTATTPRPWTALYQEGVRADIPLPTEGLAGLLASTAARHPDAPAVTFAGRSLTYAELLDQVERVANGLVALGVERGDRVALAFPNCPQHTIAFFAVARIGAVVVEHNPTLTVPELAALFASHGARVVLALTQLAPKFLPIEGVTQVVTADLGAGPVAVDDDRVVPWEALASADRIDPAHPQPAPGDLAALQYTSGTTGEAKGAMLTHMNLHVNALQVAEWVVGMQPCREAIYAILPMFHVFGLTTSITYPVAVAANVVQFPGFDVGQVLDTVGAVPPTFLCAVPPMYDTIARTAAARGTDLTSLRYALSGAMALPMATVDLWTESTHGRIVEGYGMTESAPVTFVNPLHRAKVGTIGLPVSNTEIRVTDVDDPSRVVAVGERGELQVRGPQVMAGYWNAPEATAATLLDGGWLRTGDVVTQDEDGYCTIVDRVKDLVISGGFNVAPSEVEDVLRTHPDVADVVVFGRPARPAGEQVMAALVLREGAELDVRGVRQFCHERLAPYKVPAKIVAVDALPRTALGKIQRRQAKEAILAAEQSRQD